MSTLSDSASTYDNNYALQGGVIKSDDSKSTFEGSKFENNSCNQGCIVYSSTENFDFVIKNSEVSNQYALDDGAIAYVECTTGSGFYEEIFGLSIESCKLTGNSASLGQGGMIYASYSMLNISITDSTFD